MEEFITMFYGLNFEISWHLSRYIPNEETYYQMCSGKVMYFERLVARLVCTLFNQSPETTKEYCYLADRITLIFQLMNDIVAIDSQEYQDQKGVFGDDIREGKKSLLVIHACNTVSKPKRERLLDILGMRTKNPELIQEAIEILRAAGSIEHSREKVRLLRKTLRRDGYRLFKKEESLLCFEAALLKTGKGY